MESKLIIITAAAASLATLALTTAYHSRNQNHNQFNKDPTAAPPRQPHDAPAVYDEDLIREQLSRNYAFFSAPRMARIRAANVVVVGCGGVGSHAALLLARSGVSSLRIIDFDYVTLSSLNRHATAVLADVGTPKVRSVQRAIRDVARWVEVDARVDVWRGDEGGGGLLEGADWVVDAIDNITTKVELLKYCHSHGIKVFSSMGASAKSDPTRIQISDISHTIYDPLARSVRRRLRSLNIPSGIPVVYSTEPPAPDLALLPLPDAEFQKGNIAELGALDDFRVRVLPVIGPLPAIFAGHIAAYILCELAGRPIANPLPVKNRHKTYARLLRDLTAREAEAQLSPHHTKLPLDESDIAFIYDDLHRGGRSVLPPFTVPARATLIRWDARAPLDVGNCVVMDARDAEVHARECLVGGREGADVWGAEVARVVEGRRGEVARWREWVFGA